MFNIELQQNNFKVNDTDVIEIIRLMNKNTIYKINTYIHLRLL